MLNLGCLKLPILPLLVVSMELKLIFSKSGQNLALSKVVNKKMTKNAKKCLVKIIADDYDAKLSD